jgi:twinkle protein
MDWTDIEAQLKDRAEEVARHLLPNGKRDGAEWVCGSVAGEQGRSLKVNLGAKAGVWSDFAGDAGGKTMLSLWRAVTGKEFKIAIREAKQFLGIADNFEKRVQAYVEEKPDDSTWKDAAALWAQCQPLTEGGPVWRYLVEQRRIEPAVLRAFDVRERICGRQWAMVFPYFAAPDDMEQMANLGAQTPAWMKFELVERVGGKKKEWTSRGPEKCLWGMQLVGHPMFAKARNLLIAEGEKDAMSWASYGCGAWSTLPVSVPFGAKWRGADKTRPTPNREWLDRSWDWMQRFEEVLVCMDSDEAGQKAALDIINEIGPRRCRLVRLPEKQGSGQ